MSYKNDITKLLDIQELIVVDFEIKEEEVILECKNRFDYGICPDCGNLSDNHFLRKCRRMSPLLGGDECDGIQS